MVEVVITQSPWPRGTLSPRRRTSTLARTSFGPGARFSKVPRTFRARKAIRKLRPAYSVKLVFSYVVKGIKIKITAKFRASRRLRFEDTKRVCHPKYTGKVWGLLRNRPQQSYCRFTVFLFITKTPSLLIELRKLLLNDVTLKVQSKTIIFNQLFFPNNLQGDFWLIRKKVVSSLRKRLSSHCHHDHNKNSLMICSVC